MNEASGQDRLAAALAERKRLLDGYPDEFNDGARRAYTRNKLYPSGFSAWPLERRNAWFAGFNVGYCDRERERRERGDDG